MQLSLPFMRWASTALLPFDTTLRLLYIYPILTKSCVAAQHGTSAVSRDGSKTVRRLLYAINVIETRNVEPLPINIVDPEVVGS
jgi:hypothetical protein